MVLKLWADVKYHVSTGFFRRRRAVFILLAMPPTSLERSALVMWGGWFKLQLEIRHTTAPTTGAKHWHRQKAVFYVFVLVTLTCQKDGCKPKGRFFWFVVWFVPDALIHLHCCLRQKQTKRTALWFENPPIIIPNAQLPGHIQCHHIVNGFKNKMIS